MSRLDAVRGEAFSARPSGHDRSHRGQAAMHRPHDCLLQGIGFRPGQPGQCLGIRGLKLFPDLGKLNPMISFFSDVILNYLME